MQDNDAQSLLHLSFDQEGEHVWHRQVTSRFMCMKQSETQNLLLDGVRTPDPNSSGGTFGELDSELVA